LAESLFTVLVQQLAEAFSMLVDPSRPLSFDDDEDNKDADKVAKSQEGTGKSSAKSNSAALSIIGRKTASVAELERAEIAADAAANRAMRRRQDVRCVLCRKVLRVFWWNLSISACQLMLVCESRFFRYLI
jgi:hypothetical protein